MGKIWIWKPLLTHFQYLIRVMVDLESIPVILNMRWEYTRDGMPIHTSIQTQA